MSLRLEVTPTPLAGVCVIARRRLDDSRGYLERLFCAQELAAAGWSQPVAQVNHSLTRVQGTVRGMHFQHPPHAETKLVMCLRGEVFDVALDLRCGSPTFLKWHAERLSANNGRALLIPAGCAHGFQSLTDDVEMLYCHSAAWAAQAEGGVHPLDGRVAITWPLKIATLSPRDAQLPWLETDFEGIRV